MKIVLIYLSLFVCTILIRGQHNNPNLEPAHRNHINIPEYNPTLMPLGTRNTLSGTWTEVRPNVPRVDYWGVYFTNTDTGFACGVNGVIIKTTNGGNNWITLNTGTTKTLRTIGSYDGSLITVAGDSGIILNSTDLGETWQAIQSGVSKNLWNLQMITENIGWIVGEVSVALKTTNGGQTWINQLTPYTLLSYWDVSFIDSLFGYICCNNGIIIRTTDGGLNWDTKIAGDGYGLFTIKAVTKTKAVALGFAGKHVYTSDGGDSWQFITYLGSSFNKIAFIDTLHGFAVGNTGSFETFDSGLNWNLRWLDMKSANNIAFVNENTGWLVGSNLTIENTYDAGTNWNTNIINDNFKDAFFINENIGWLISDKVYRTSDGCRSLTEQIGFNYLNPSCVVFTDSLTGFIGISGSRILKTTNNGNSWSDAIITGLDDTLSMVSCITFIDKNTGWAVSGRNIIKTTDTGENWFTQFLHPASGFTGISFTDSVNGGVSGGRPQHTTDGGLSWIQIENQNLWNCNDVYFSSQDTGWIAKYTVISNSLFKTTDGGDSWVEIPEVIGARKFRFTQNPNHWLIIGFEQYYMTYDNGITWYEFTNEVPTGLTSFSMPTNNIGYAVGNTGMVLQYYDTTYIPVELTSFTLSINNNDATLNWQTATEINNSGFQIERRKTQDERSDDWNNIGFVNSNGTTTEPQSYSFVNKNLEAGKYQYRLKQIDYDGTFEYSNVVEVEIAEPLQFSLEQNYPNPFNPVTSIQYEISSRQFVTLKVYDVLGKEVATLVNEEKPAGSYNVEFKGSNLASGIYYYQLKAVNTETSSGQVFIDTKKMILLK